MKKILISSLIFLSYFGIAYAQIGPGQDCPQSSPCYVISSGGTTPTTVNQGAQAAAAAGNTWFVQQFLAGSAVSAANPEPVTPGTGATFPVSAVSLPLPTGASTAANQTSVQSAPGTPQTTAETIQGNASGVPVPVSLSSTSSSISTKPGTYTEVALDISTTTSANTAVTALNATHRSAGGWIENPSTATTVICVNTITTAAFSSGACTGSNNGIAPGQTFNIPANANTVSVVSSDASHAYSGEGLQ